MSLSDVAAVSGIVSSVAVVISLAYLGYQIRQNTLHQRASMQQGRAARNVELISRTAETDIAAAMLRGRTADPAIEPVQLEQFLRVLTAIFLNFEDGYLLRQSGMLDQASIDGDEEALRGHIFAQPGYRIAWNMLRSGMQPNFRDYMDRLMSETPIVTSADRVAIWRSQTAAPSTQLKDQ
jgi:hypothetical protein